jgi:hypothetical protein
VPLICPTCQAFGPNGRLRWAPATVHGVVFDIFGGSRDQHLERSNCLSRSRRSGLRREHRAPIRNEQQNQRPLLIEIQGMGKCAHRMCKHFRLVSDVPVLNTASEDASPRSGRSGRLGRKRCLGEFNDRQPTGLAQVASKRHSAS